MIWQAKQSLLHLPDSTFSVGEVTYQTAWAPTPLNPIKILIQHSATISNECSMLVWEPLPNLSTSQPGNLLNDQPAQKELKRTHELGLSSQGAGREASWDTIIADDRHLKNQISDNRESA